MSDVVLQEAVRNSRALVAYYIEHVCQPDVKEVIHAHEVIQRDRKETVCYITAAALAWLISGQDIASPFSGVWDTDERASAGVHSVVAFRSDPDSEYFEDSLEHVLIILADACVVDSHFSKGERLGFRPMSRLLEFDGLDCRSIRFDPAPHMDLRLAMALRGGL